RARRRRHLSMAARRARDRAAVARRAGFWRLDRRGDGDDGADGAAPPGPRRGDGPEAAGGRHIRSVDRQLHRLRPRRVSRSGGVSPYLRRGHDRSAGRMGHLPRDVLPHRLEAVHVQPDPGAFAGRGEGAGAGRLGRRRQDRAAQCRRTLCRGLAGCPLRDRARCRALRRDGATGAAGPPGRELYRRELNYPAAQSAARGAQEEVMHVMYFTEQPMSAYPANIGLEFGATALMFSNKYFDSVAGSRLYNEYLEQYIYAEEMGVEGFMLNEHHNAPFCMQAKCNIFASILAAVTKKAKIVLLGNPLPLAENPVRRAEELAMIAMTSRGRLVSGFVRGGGQEQLAAGVSPAYNRERFEEAHDLVVAAWPRQGPFRWEGTHYQHRVVNPWAVPLQKPYPRVWIPGVLSKETIIWAAKQRYPYIALNTSIEATKSIWNIYDQVAAEPGDPAAPETRG